MILASLKRTRRIHQAAIAYMLYTLTKRQTTMEHLPPISCRSKPNHVMGLFSESRLLNVRPRCSMMPAGFSPRERQDSDLQIDWNSEKECLERCCTKARSSHCLIICLEYRPALLLSTERLEGVGLLVLITVLSGA